MLLTLKPPTDIREWTRAAGTTQAAARKLTGGLSSPGKMPCHSYGLPAAECNVGSKLRAATTPDNPTVCGGCYALKGSYRMYPEVIPAQYRRLSSVYHALAYADARADWVRAMVALVGWQSRDSRVFRWHDSGDLQTVEHLSMLAEVADALPWVTFWLPTREGRILRDWMAEYGALPANFTVRQSAALVGHIQSPEKVRDSGRTVSAVALKGQTLPDGAHACPAYKQDGACGSCRACWSPNVPVVVYPLH